MSDCPDARQLAALEAGALTDEAAERLVAHVEACGLCREMIERLRRSDLDGRILRKAAGGGAIDAVGGAPAAVATAGTSKRDWDIPDYDCLRLCGEGAFGTVWAVRDRVGTHRALKVIDMGRLAQQEVRCRELSALETFCRQVEPHHNLIRVYHVGIHGDKLYYTMDLADDHATRRPARDGLNDNYRPMTLARVMSGQPVPPDTAIEVVLRLLRGLAHLHRVGLSHRDIKPANVVFVERQPKLSDIGMITANMVSPSQVGTPEYMPPDGQMDATADTYALGRVLYELLAGIDLSQFPKLPEYVLGQSDAWDLAGIASVIERACAPRATDRFANADRMREALELHRLWSFDALFDARRGPRVPATPNSADPWAPVLVAALNVLPWLMGFVLLWVLLEKTL
jgi:serine/threonine protein kinase